MLWPSTPMEYFSEWKKNTLNKILVGSFDFLAFKTCLEGNFNEHLLYHCKSVLL